MIGLQALGYQPIKRLWCVGIVIVYTPKVPYSRKLSREKTFANWWKIQFSRIAHFCSAKDAMPPNFAEKTFACFAKVFSLESFPLYGTVFIYRSETIVTCMVCQMLHTNYWLLTHLSIMLKPTRTRTWVFELQSDALTNWTTEALKLEQWHLSIDTAQLTSWIS